jgi:hypothetical protein
MITDRGKGDIFVNHTVAKPVLFGNFMRYASIIFLFKLYHYVLKQEQCWEFIYSDVYTKELGFIGKLIFDSAWLSGWRTQLERLTHERNVFSTSVRAISLLSYKDTPLKTSVLHSDIIP